jgi:hypothetical protein
VTTLHGYELVVDGKWSEGKFSAVTLTGPVKTVYEGVLPID